MFFVEGILVAIVVIAVLGVATFVIGYIFFNARQQEVVDEEEPRQEDQDPEERAQKEREIKQL